MWDLDFGDKGSPGSGKAARGAGVVGTAEGLGLIGTCQTTPLTVCVRQVATTLVMQKGPNDKWSPRVSFFAYCTCRQLLCIPGNAGWLAGWLAG